MAKYPKYVLIGCVILWSSQLTSALALSFNPYPTGTLVNDSGTIYFISGSQKVPFTNWQAFSGLGYSLQNVVQGDLTNYPLAQGYTINSANAAHPWGSWLIYQGTVYYSTQGGLIGVPSSQVFTSNGGDWQYIVRANQYDVAALNANPNLAVLQMNDPRVGSSTYSGGNPVGSTLQVSPASLSFTTTANGPSPTPQSIFLNPGSGVSWSAQVQPGQLSGFINLQAGNAGPYSTGSFISGTGGSIIAVDIGIDTGPFTAGNFSDSILFSSNGQTQTVGVTLTVLSSGSNPTLAVNPTSLSFTASSGRVPSLQPVTFNWPGFVPASAASVNAVLFVQVSSNSLSWLSIANSSQGQGGSTMSVPASGTFYVSVNAAGLVPGSYTGSVLINNINSSVPTIAVTIPVTLTVAGSTVSGSPIIYSVTPTMAPIGSTVEIYGSGFSGSVTVEIDNLVAVASAASSGPYVPFVVPSSLVPYCAPGTACPQFVELLQPGTHSLSVISNAVQSNAVMFTVTSSSDFPTPTPTPAFTSTTAPVISVSPSSGPPNVLVTLTATSGTLFTPSNNQVNVSGNTVAFLSSSNGQTLSLQLPPLSVGSHSITVVNANGSSNVVTYTVTQ